MKRGIFISEKYTNVTTKSFKNYLNDISQISIFETPKDEVECAIRAKNGDHKSMHELVSRNLRFVVSVAKKYENANAPLPDLINQGNVGLIQAVNKFDHTRGNKFISYAVWWIRKEIMDYLNNSSRLIRMPMTRVAHISRFNDETSKLTQKEGRTITAYDMYDKLDGFTNDEIDNMLEIDKLKATSYDKKMTSDEGEGNSMVDMIESDCDETDHLLMNDDKQYIINNLFTNLTDTQEFVIRKYFGICDDNKTMNLSEVGVEIGVSRERVRQIKEKALLKLRLNSDKLGLNDLSF
mgnify:CR=1 FL=1|tara:strand:+ start:7860 stop:8741 length:882 start_codon:yes stop_codon:yes gene_type:complete